VTAIHSALFFSVMDMASATAPQDLSGLIRSFPPFSPPPVLRNPHVQTVLAARKPRSFPYGWARSEPMEIRLERDGSILAEVSWQPGERRDAPALFLLHGLEGSTASHYLLGTSKKAYAAGFHAVRVNTRNCGGTEHMTPTLYNAGLSQDVAAIIEHLEQQCGVREIYAAGVSLGANILLKYLGEQAERAASHVRGAAALSCPIDLGVSVARMLEPQNWVYQRYFVRRLKERMLRKIAFFPEIADVRKIDRIRTIYEFDDVITAPHFGFGTADNYYRLASSAPLLRMIRVPTLIVQSIDDPMIPFEPFLRSGIEDNPFLAFLGTKHGGHAGFLGIRPACRGDQDAYWAECRIVQFLSCLVRQRV
jgi:uncharacterized protein